MAMPVMRWLESRGFVPYGEVPWSGRGIDIVGVNGPVVEVVEMKLSLTKHVIYQASVTLASANRSWCAIATAPRNLEDRAANGMLGELGVLRVIGSSVEVLREAPSGERNGRWSDLLIGMCSDMEPWGKAGLPTLAGVGPAQNVRNRVDKYLQQHPDAKWQEIFEAVPNHYVHPRSMRGAMGVVEAGRKRE